MESPTDERPPKQDPCSICFEKEANAAFLRGCNHGGLCYSCAIDIFITSGACPFCRKAIKQIVTISLAGSEERGHRDDRYVFLDVSFYRKRRNNLTTTHIVDVTGPDTDRDAPQEALSKRDDDSHWCSVACF